MSVKSSIFSSIALLLMSFLFVVIIFGDKGYNDLGALRMEKAAIVEKNDMLIRKNSTLYRKIERLKNDPKYIESIARHDLGMIGEDEVVYTFKKGQKRK